MACTPSVIHRILRGLAAFIALDPIVDGFAMQFMPGSQIFSFFETLQHKLKITTA
jgi:hypothetical protein